MNETMYSILHVSSIHAIDVVDNKPQKKMYNTRGCIKARKKTAEWASSPGSYMQQHHPCCLHSIKQLTEKEMFSQPSTNGTKRLKKTAVNKMSFLIFVPPLFFHTVVKQQLCD